MNHVAVVPVARLDLSTRCALRYAGTLTPRVVALQVTDGASSELPDAWGEQAHDVPLVLLEATAVPSEGLLRAIEVLKGTEHADRVTVVMPAASGDLPRVLRSGVVVREVPGAFRQE